MKSDVNTKSFLLNTFSMTLRLKSFKYKTPISGLSCSLECFVFPFHEAWNWYWVPCFLLNKTKACTTNVKSCADTENRFVSFVFIFSSIKWLGRGLGEHSIKNSRPLLLSIILSIPRWKRVSISNSNSWMAFDKLGLAAISLLSLSYFFFNDLPQNK